MLEKTEFIIQIQLVGNNVDKVVSVGVSPDEFENIVRAEKIGMKLIKRVEIIQETTLVSQVEQRVGVTGTEQSSTVAPSQPQQQPQPRSPQLEKSPQEIFNTKFGKPTPPQIAHPSDQEIDDMIVRPNAKPNAGNDGI